MQVVQSHAWWERLAELLKRVEEEESWPDAHLQSYLSFISKGAGEEPLAQRPLSILTLVSRLWAAVRLGQVSEWSQQWLHKSCIAAPGRSADEIWARLSGKIEVALAMKRVLGGLNFDFAKIYDLDHMSRTPWWQA